MKFLKEGSMISCKKNFPALRKDWIYLDGPGGTQVCRQAIKAQTEQLKYGVCNFHGVFDLSKDMDALSEGCRELIKNFLGAERSSEIHFGPNMTTLSFQLAATLSKKWKKGDNIILSRLDHYANVDPFKQLAEEKGVEVRWLTVNPETFKLSSDELRKICSKKTRLLALTGASNAVGTLQNVKELVKIAHHYGSLVHVDAVHMAPHTLIDVKSMNCDFLTCSAYKFYCPHLGIQYIHKKHEKWIKPMKLSTSPDVGPMRYETGTQNQVSMAGVSAGLEWLKGLAQIKERNIREQFIASMNCLQEHERELSFQFIQKLKKLKQWKLHGSLDPEERTPTFALEHHMLNADECAKKLSKMKVSSWSGHFYARDIVKALELEKKGGLLRLGVSLYHSTKDIEKVIQCLKSI